MIEAGFFYLFSGVMLAAAFCVVFSRQPVYSVLSLLVAMFCLAALFIMLGAYFVAGLQILSYAGAVLVLFLFVMMLLNLEPEALVRWRPFTQRGVGVVIAVVFCAQLIRLFHDTPATARAVASMPIPLATVERLGYLLFTTYLLPFELTSFLILAAIIAAVTLARSSKRDRSS